jgi:protein dithiol oxidoreductase (disulfide-forming)
MTARLAALCGAVMFLLGAAAAEPMEQVDYQLLDPPRRIAGGNKIEVIEFFYYGCESCARFEAPLNEWLSRKPADVDFHRIPALRRTDWIPLTRIFFALQEVSALPRLHDDVYRAVHVDGLDLRSKAVAADWAAEKGIDRARFEAALASESIAMAVQRARDTTVEYGVRTTPTLVVDGRYTTSAELLGDLTALLPVLEDLIDKARRERTGSSR